jgi:hypothetical protein
MTTNEQNITHRMRVDSRIFTRANDGAITVQWLGHGTTETSDPEARRLTEREKRTLALALLDGYRWRAV